MQLNKHRVSHIVLLLVFVFCISFSITYPFFANAKTIDKQPDISAVCSDVMILAKKTAAMQEAGTLTPNTVDKFAKDMIAKAKTPSQLNSTIYVLEIVYYATKLKVYSTPEDAISIINKYGEYSYNQCMSTFTLTPKKIDPIMPNKKGITYF